MSTPLEFHVYDSTNTTMLAVLEQAAERSYQAELNGTGAGKFVIPVGEVAEQTPTDLILVSASDTLAIATGDSLGWTSTTAVDKSTYVALGNVVRVRLGSTDVGAFVIEDLHEENLLTPGRVLAASGRGLLALLERAIVWPSDTATYTSVQKAYLAKTFAYMIRDLRSEAAARGVTLPSVDFTDSVDSASVSFTDSSTMNFRAGTTLLDVAEQHAELGLDIWVTPAGVLQYFVSKGTDRSATVILREGKNAVRASRTQTARHLANAILGEGQYILSVQTDATSIASYGRREKLAQHGNVSHAATLASLTQLDRAAWKDPQTMIDLRVDDSLAPFVDYTVGDTVKLVLANAGLSSSYRVRAINLEEDGDGVVVGVVLNRLIDEHLERIAKALRRRLMSPIDSEQHGNSDPTVGGWALTNTYLVRDTGSAATSAGLAPDDYPFYAGQVYASRASAPFRVTPAGALTATSATITGTITATAGAIGGWTVGASSLTGGNATLHSSGYLLLGTTNDIARLDAADATYRLWIGNATAASAPFRVSKGGALTATSATITGTITATAGDIGGWTINSTYLAKDTGTAATSAGLAPSDYPFYAGATYANRASAPFRVTPAGALTATAGAMGGWTIGASTLSGGDATLGSSGYLDLGTGNDIVRLDASNATYRLWIGNATAASAPFRITKAGYVTAISGSIGGFTLGGSTMYNGTFVLDAGNGRVTFNTGAYFSTGGGTVINATCSNLSSGGGITAADWLVVTSTSATNIIHGDTQIDAARIGYIGCYGTSPVATKQTVTGSRGGNAALASLLTALATYGIITNSSTA